MPSCVYVSGRKQDLAAVLWVITCRWVFWGILNAVVRAAPLIAPLRKLEQQVMRVGSLLSAAILSGKQVLFCASFSHVATVGIASCLAW